MIVFIIGLWKAVNARRRCWAMIKGKISCKTLPRGANGIVQASGKYCEIAVNALLPCERFSNNYFPDNISMSETNVPITEQYTLTPHPCDIITLLVL
jgi:hypothetical protein